MPVSFGAVKFQHVGVVEFYRTFEFPDNVLINFLLAFSNFLIYKLQLGQEYLFLKTTTTTTTTV